MKKFILLVLIMVLIGWITFINFIPKNTEVGLLSEAFYIVNDKENLGEDLGIKHSLKLDLKDDNIGEVKLKSFETSPHFLYTTRSISNENNNLNVEGIYQISSLDKNVILDSVSKIVMKDGTTNYKFLSEIVDYNSDEIKDKAKKSEISAEKRIVTDKEEKEFFKSGGANQFDTELSLIHAINPSLKGIEYSENISLKDSSEDKIWYVSRNELRENPKYERYKEIYIEHLLSYDESSHGMPTGVYVDKSKNKAYVIDSGVKCESQKEYDL